MFSKSPGSGGKQDREVGHSAPAKPPHLQLAEVARVCATAPSDQPGADEVRGAGSMSRNPDLLGPVGSGKFDRVAPDRGLCWVEGGARLIFENSTVC